ncbi:hypothetical protein CXF85_19830 [Colwellia sp. 75C3]|uniref:hypothetical protein n=1 Tax=Colwellia sp. 75C3 TaxID=888425 RepID=UPI000C321EEE|nr:hypothetical protein [Colwellia sp. 75C3]PKG81015.1 hypothetical protein CXF85_19830 [Colwellia sp. 75C3]
MTTKKQEKRNGIPKPKAGCVGREVWNRIDIIIKKNHPQYFPSVKALTDDLKEQGRDYGSHVIKNTRARYKKFHDHAEKELAAGYTSHKVEKKKEKKVIIGIAAEPVIEPEAVETEAATTALAEVVHEVIGPIEDPYLESFIEFQQFKQSMKARGL